MTTNVDTRLRLTQPRLRALTILMLRHLSGKDSFRSNRTGSIGDGLLYWQSVDWLVANGLAELHGHANSLVRPTRDGRYLYLKAIA